MAGTLKSLWIVAVALVIGGCGGIIQTPPLAASHTLYATISEQTRGFVIDTLSPHSGEINLQTLQPTSDTVIAKWCENEKDFACINRILTSIDKNHHRQGILARYNALLEAHAAHQNKLKSLHDEVAPAYAADQRNRRLEFRINDTTKLYGGEAIAPDKLVRVGLHDLSAPKATDHSAEIDRLFPVALDLYEPRIEALMSALEVRYKEEQTTYFHTLARLVQSYPIERLAHLVQGDYHFEVRAKNSIARTADKPERVILDIVGKTLKNVIPAEFKAHNGDLEVVCKKETMAFHNKSNVPMALKNVTLMYQDAALALSIEPSFQTIAPYGDVVIASRMFKDEAFEKVSTFDWMTQDKAAETAVIYGVAVTYQKASKVLKLNAPQKTTLHKLLSGW